RAHGPAWRLVRRRALRLPRRLRRQPGRHPRRSDARARRAQGSLRGHGRSHRARRRRRAPPDLRVHHRPRAPRRVADRRRRQHRRPRRHAPRQAAPGPDSGKLFSANRFGAARVAGLCYFWDRKMIVHLIDGTYELFRHFYGIRRMKKGDPPFGAVREMLQMVLQMIETGATHIGVATDHVIESFRNELWDGYKTGAGIDAALWTQFHPLEEALTAMGVVVWPMIELEANDALASTTALAAANPAVERICIWTPDKDLAQCVVAGRVVQVDRKSGKMRDADDVREKF